MRVTRVVFTAATVAVGLTVVVLAQGQGAEPRVLSGSDIGFRVERMEAGRASGTLVVRIDGQWVEAVSAPKAMAVR